MKILCAVFLKACWVFKYHYGELQFSFYLAQRIYLLHKCRSYYKTCSIYILFSNYCAAGIELSLNSLLPPKFVAEGIAVFYLNNGIFTIASAL